MIEMPDERMMDMSGERMSGAPDEGEAYAEMMNRAQSLAHGSAVRLANMRHDRMAAQAARINRTEAALGASVVVGQLQRSFPFDDRDDPVSRIANVVIPWVPALFLKPEKRGDGVAGAASDPRVWSLVLAGGIAVAERMREKANEARGAKEEEAKEKLDGGSLSIVRDVPILDQGRRFKLHLGGDLDPEAMRWETDNEGAVTVDKGLITAVGKGSATITASADGRYDNVVVRVQ